MWNNNVEVMATMAQYNMYELSFQGDEPTDSQASVDLHAAFSWRDRCGNVMSKEVKGFYAGCGIYKVRFLPEMDGEYTWVARGCVKAEGSDICAVSAVGSHGIVRADGTHFTHADETAFQPIGTTIYALAHQEQWLIDQTLDTLKSAPFNKVRHCVFPKHYDYNHNEPELFTFEKGGDGRPDVHRPCFAFWDRFERIIAALSDVGIQSDLILFHPYDKWGFASLSMDDNLVYLDYMLRRLSAFPSVWWSMANEYDLCFNKSMSDWHAIEQFIACNDPNIHLLSNHNCFAFYDFARPAISHCCVQTTQVEFASKWLSQYNKPLIYDECCYEGDLPMNWGNISAFEMVNRFWIACVQGAYATHGEVYLSDDEILWWSKGGKLKGASPARIAFLKKTLDELPAPLDPWEVDRLEGLDPELAKTIMESPFIKLMESMPEAQRDAMLAKDGEFRGRCGDAAFIQYLARHCNRTITWLLPTDKRYDIDAIDIWEMTRTTVMTGATGRVTIPLPGKEGIAILAQQI
jgi:hypothetical protein